MAASLVTGQASRIHTVSRAQHASAVLLAAADPAAQGELWALLRSWGHRVDIVADDYALHQALKRPESVPIVILDTDLPGLQAWRSCINFNSKLARRRSWTILLTEARTVNRSSSDTSSAQHRSRRRPHQAHRRVRTPRLAARRLAHPGAFCGDGRGNRRRPL